MTKVAAFDPHILNLAFASAGRYGTKVGWLRCMPELPDAHAEGPTPISACCRPPPQCRALSVCASGAARRHARHRAGPLMITMGLRRSCSRPSCCTAGATSSGSSPILDRAYGIITFAFAWAGPLANSPAPAHDDARLTKSRFFFAVGHVAQVRARRRSPTSPGDDEPPLLGWGLVLGSSPSLAWRRRHLHQRVPPPPSLTSRWARPLARAPLVLASSSLARYRSCPQGLAFGEARGGKRARSRPR